MLKKLFVFVLIISVMAPSVSLAANITLQEKLDSVTSELSTIQYLNAPVTIKNLTDQETRDVIKGAISWMEAAQEPSGHFAYEYFPYEDRYTTEDNMVRQTGSLYELGEVARRDKTHVHKIDDTIIRSIKYFESVSRKGSYGGKNFRCIADKATSGTCKLGATSLALVGILGFVEGYPEQAKKYETLITDYANYILAMKKANTGFRAYFYTISNTTKEEESPYSNGEALWALVRYWEYKGKPEDVKKVIDDMVLYIESPKMVFDSSLYLWAMAALKDLYKNNPQKHYADYAKRYTDWRMAPFKEKRTSDHNYCPYIEGVASAYPMLKATLSEKEALTYKKEIDFWLAKSAMLQVKQKNLVKFTPGKAELFTRLAQPQKALGGFLTGHAELSQRIDFTQHCLSGYIQNFVDIEGKKF